jgi:hypothetical protein
MNNYIVNDREHPTLIPSYPTSINVHNAPYSEGTINPIQKHTVTKVINIDSTFRENYSGSSSTNFTWDLNKKETKVVSMRVSALDIPVCWYTIDDINHRNQFTIKVHNWVNEGEHDQYLITIPPGNYFSEAFVITLNSIFQTIGDGLNYLIAAIDPHTLKTIIRAVDKRDTLPITNRAPFVTGSEYYSPNFYFEIDFFPERDKFLQAPSPLIKKNIKQFQEFQRTVGWFIGFRKFDYIVTSGMSVQQSAFIANTPTMIYNCALSSEAIYSNSINNYCFLSIDDHHNNCVCQPIVSSTGESYISNNIMARITVDSLPNTILYDNGRDKIFKERTYMGPITLEKLKINLLNKYGEIINLNETDFSFTLELTELY